MGTLRNRTGRAIRAGKLALILVLVLIGAHRRPLSGELAAPDGCRPRRVRQLPTPRNSRSIFIRFVRAGREAAESRTF